MVFDTRRFLKAFPLYSEERILMKRTKVNNGYANGLENLANFVQGLLIEICFLFDWRRVLN